ncbi:androgen-induced gene 1 protein-like isoform X2 [Cimex lectularius]|uniref:Uncharacterized protein n=1 Tax=Cimex lectularius TaxID=79782 RepID=A0A8I6S4L0_CIMLE|nr:androgen-induced gene 1 protein-like isoform X2 [Cimex lectularius]
MDHYELKFRPLFVLTRFNIHVIGTTLDFYTLHRGLKIQIPSSAKVAGHIIECCGHLTKFLSFWNLSGALHFAYACYYDWTYVVVPKEVLPLYGTYGYKLKFLTFWDAVTQACYFSLCVFIDIWGSKNDQNERNVLVRIKDYVEASIAFPIAMFVGVTFWGLMAVDRELVLPAALDPYFPSWLNHMMHTNILIFQFLEIITSTRVYPQRKHALVGLMTFQTTYLIWMHIVHYKSGVWAYPIFEKLNVPLRIGFFVGCFTLGGLMYFLGEKLHYLLWQDVREHQYRD